MVTDFAAYPRLFQEMKAVHVLSTDGQPAAGGVQAGDGDRHPLRAGPGLRRRGAGPWTGPTSRGKSSPTRAAPGASSPRATDAQVDYQAAHHHQRPAARLRRREGDRRPGLGVVAGDVHGDRERGARPQAIRRCDRRARYARVALDVEAQRLAGPVAGVVDADAGRAGDWTVRGCRRSATNRPLAADVRSRPLSASVTPSGAAQLAGPGADARIGGRRAARCGSAARMSTAPALPSGSRDEVHAVVHAVDQVDVQVTGRAEHDRRARRGAAAGVRGEVARAEIGLDLDDAGQCGSPPPPPSAPASCPADRAPPPRWGARRTGGTAAAAARGRRRGSRAGRGTVRDKQQALPVDVVGQADQASGRRRPRPAPPRRPAGRRGDRSGPPAGGSAGTGTRSG